MRTQWLSRAAYSGMFVFGIVMALLGAVLPLVARRVEFDLGRAGNLFLVMNLCQLASVLGLGWLTDRFGKRLPFVGGAFCVAGAAALIAVARDYAALACAIALLGVGGGALNGSTNALISDLHSEPARKNAALNLLGVFFGIGALFLPFLIGSLLSALGFEMILLVAAILAGGAGLFYLMLKFPAPARREGVPLGEAVRLAREPMILLFGLLLFFQSGNEFILGGYATSFLTAELKLPMAAASYLLALYWASIMLARLYLSRFLLRARGETTVMASALASAAGVLLLVRASGAWTAAAALLLIGAGFASIFPTTLGAAGARYAGRSGTVFGILIAIALTGGMTLPWLVGQLARDHGLPRALLVAAFNAIMICGVQLLLRARGK